MHQWFGVAARVSSVCSDKVSSDLHIYSGSSPGLLATRQRTWTSPGLDDLCYCLLLYAIGFVVTIKYLFTHLELIFNSGDELKRASEWLWLSN